MTDVCVLLADGFEEIEAITILDILRRASIKASAVGVTGDEVTGNHGLTLKTDTRLADAINHSWDMVVLPGGTQGAEHLRDNEQVQQLIRRHHDQGRKLAAICAAPIALARAGVLRGKKATCYPGFDNQLSESTYSDKDAVIVDGTVTTSRGPATAMPFALALVEQLEGSAAAHKIAKATLYA